MLFAGCARISGHVRAVAEVEPVPGNLSWQALPGPGADGDNVAAVADILAPGLARYGWVRAVRPDLPADVLVQIWWETGEPELVVRERPFAYSAFGPGPGWNRYYGFRRYGGYGWRDPYWRSRYNRGWPSPMRSLYREPPLEVRAYYAHTLHVLALRPAAMPPALRESVLPPPVAALYKEVAGAGDAAKPDTGPRTDPKTGLNAAPSPASDAVPGSDIEREMPPGAVLWDVSVLHIGTRANALSLLPYLAAAAAEAAGRTVQENVVVNGDLEVSVKD